MVERLVANQKMGVRFSLPAQITPKGVFVWVGVTSWELVTRESKPD